MRRYLFFQKPTYLFILLIAAVCSSCSTDAATSEPPSPEAAVVNPPPAEIQPVPAPSSEVPDLQREIADDRFRTSSSPIARFDFKNFSFQLPRGWQNPDGSDEITLKNGRIAPVETSVSDKMDDAAKAEAKQQRRIGASFVAAKYFDATGDGQDEAAVILKIETGGAAVPQVLYLFSWNDDGPEMIWSFRTGDRADGGLKDVRVEDGLLVVELYGQDRFILGGVETGKITGDEEQLCCPTYFTRTRYKWNGSTFLMQGKRLTYSVADPSSAPLENYGDVVNNPTKAKK